MNPAVSDSEAEERESTTPLDVWFDDGNLVIQAEEKSFRVYRGILSFASSVFRDMLSLAVLKESEAIDGCPVVRVSDSAADVSFFLKSLHDTEFFLPPPAKTTFAATAGILRLSTKYDVPFLRRRALDHISVVYPTSLEDWDASHHWLSPCVDDHFSAIILARQFDIAWIRPMAIYHCMSKPIEEIYDIFQNACLSPEDRKFCIMAIQKLKASEMICVTASMKKAARCGASPCGSIEGGLTSIANSEGADPLAQTNKVLNVFGFCKGCSNVSRPNHVLERVGRWNAIPDIFQCPSWEDLTRMRKTAC